MLIDNKPVQGHTMINAFRESALRRLYVYFFFILFYFAMDSFYIAQTGLKFLDSSISCISLLSSGITGLSLCLVLFLEHPHVE